jgi:hypothetical protein
MNALMNGIQSMKLDDGSFLYFWYANNKGRGSDNCTIIRSTAPRAAVSAKQTDVIASTRTSAWHGHVNFSKAVQNELGL